MAKRRRPVSKQRETTASAAAPSPRRVAPPPSRNERVLRERISRFAYQGRFKPGVEQALRLYFGPDVLKGNVLTLDEAEIPGFQEWYIQDYVTSEGERLIDLFAAEMGPQLPAAQQQILADWRRVNRLHLFEVQAVEPGIGVTVQDLLNDEVLQVNDISASYALVKWEVILARPSLTEGRLSFAGSMIALSPLQKPDLLDYARELWGKYQAQRPQATLSDFYRDHSLDLLRRQEEIRNAPPPSVYSPEGHPFAPCTARYAVTDPHAVRELLDKAEEFAYAGPADEDKAALAYVWLLTGRSRIEEVPVNKGMMLRTEWISATGESSSLRSLGDVRLWIDRLELHCISRERLEAGKALLSQMAGRRLRHRGDEYKDWEALSEAMEHFPSPGPAFEIDPAVNRRINEELLEEWLDNPVPMLGDKSPREAARDPAKRKEMDELLKVLEYLEDQKRRNGEPYLDIKDVRRALGLPDG